MSSLPAGESLREELLSHYAETVAPEVGADNDALAALVKAHPNVEYEAAGKLRRAGMLLMGRGPKKVADAAPAAKWVTFHGAEVPSVGFAPDLLERFVRAARTSVDMVVSEEDLTPGLIDALADAKKRNVALKIVGGPFSAGFMYSPVAERLRREGIVIHYKIGLSDAPMGVYDRALLLTGSYNYSANSHEHAFVLDDDRRRISSFDEALRAGWAQSPELPAKPAKAVRFNGVEFPSVSFDQNLLIRAVDAAQRNIALSVREQDLTPEMIAALARAKSRNVDLRIVGNLFSFDFVYGPVAEALRRAGVVVHYKSAAVGEVGTDLMNSHGRGVAEGADLLGIYDNAFTLMRSPGTGPLLVANGDLGPIKSFESTLRAGWDQGSETPPAPAKVLRFNGVEFPAVSFNQDALIRAIDAARTSVDLSVTEKDVTPELVQALARAKARNVSMRIVGDAFSAEFAYGPVAAELRRQGIVIHYKIAIGDKMGLLGAYDRGFSLRGTRNISRTADQALVADADPGRVAAFEKEIRAAWGYWAAVSLPDKPVK
ncbi:MAG: hypothetical protein ACHQ2Z_11400 [Elusimicrobiota bacterium]